MRRMTRHIALEEVEFLTSCGMSASEIVTSLDSTPTAISKALARCGRRELAAMFERLRERNTHPCVECGAPVASKRSPRCVPCGHRQGVRTRYGVTA